MSYKLSIRYDENKDVTIFIAQDNYNKIKREVKGNLLSLENDFKKNITRYELIEELSHVTKEA